MKRISILLLSAMVVGGLAVVAAQQQHPPIYSSELIFPLEHWHNHASCVVECPNGDLLVCWFHGSGERQADDVKVEARSQYADDVEQWSLFGFRCARNP